MTYRPSEWARFQGAEIIQELKAGFPAINPIVSKQRIGTYAVRELVHAYAMWISPEYQLKVISFREHKDS